MIGGKVSEICCVPDDDNLYWVQVAEDSYGKHQYCGVYIEKNETSDKIQMGDYLWWQSGVAYWTPLKSCFFGAEFSIKSGEDFDIPIPKVGYSGPNNPWEGVLT